MARVSVVQCSSYQEEELRRSLVESLENLGGLGQYVRPGCKVVLKANLLMEKKPEEAVTTHPMLVKILTELVQKEGGTVTIIDSPAGVYSHNLLKSVYTVTGMSDVAAETGAALNYDLSLKEVSNPEGRYFKKVEILKPLAEADVVINLPKLKTHVQMMFTGAVKNMFGAIAGDVKAKYHFKMSNYDEFANTLIDIFLSAKPTLNIMDAVVGMEGHGPSAGNPKQVGLIFASDNAFALDLAALHVIKGNPLEVPILRNAMERGLCPRHLDDVEIVGADIRKVRIADFDIPKIHTLKDVRFINNSFLKNLLSNLMPRPVFNHSKCIRCYDCVRCCPAKIVKVVDKKPVIDPAKCIQCFCCQEQCPAKAVTIKKSRLGDWIISAGVFIKITFFNRKNKKTKETK